MRDRLAAVGGDLDISSVVGEGTVVTGFVPLGVG
jgi:signal transduction histidine kinase